MNRRRLLGAGGALALAGLAGCLDDFSEHFQGSVGIPIPIEIYNDGDRTYNLGLTGYDPETDRETYDQAFSVKPAENVKPANLEGTDQQLRVTRFSEEGDDLVEVGFVTTDTHLIRIVFDDDSLTLDIRDRESDDNGENSTPSENGNASSDDGANGSEDDANSSDDANA